MEAKKITNIVLPTSPNGFRVTFGLVHYSSTDTVNWHVQMQVTTHDDPTFAARLTGLDKDTSSSQTRWTFRNDSAESSGQSFSSWPSGGVQTTKTPASYLKNNRMGTCMYVFGSSEDDLLERGKMYLVRARQHDGSSWGSWYVFPIYVD